MRFVAVAAVACDIGLAAGHSFAVAWELSFVVAVERLVAIVYLIVAGGERCYYFYYFFVEGLFQRTVQWGSFSV